MFTHMLAVKYYYANQILGIFKGTKLYEFSNSSFMRKLF